MARAPALPAVQALTSPSSCAGSYGDVIAVPAIGHGMCQSTNVIPSLEPPRFLLKVLLISPCIGRHRRV